MDTLADRNRVIEIEGGAGPASALRLADRAMPCPADGQVLIAVDAAGVNRPDVFQRMGFYPPPPGASDVLGLEVAGRVVQPAGRWREGDAVVALLGGGGYGAYVAADARHVLPAPSGLTAIEAAALPEAVFTVYANVFEDGRLQAGETLLVHGGASGIGTTAIQLARAAGARVVATVRGAEKAKALASLGADLVIDTTNGDFVDPVSRIGGADVVLDMVGAEFFSRNLEALNPRGRIVFIAGLGGMEITVPIMALMAKRLVVTGSTLRARDADEKARLTREVERVVWPWIETGKVRPVIDRTFPLAAAAEAHARMEGGAHVGKLVLVPG